MPALSLTESDANLDIRNLNASRCVSGKKFPPIVDNSLSEMEKNWSLPTLLIVNFGLQRARRQQGTPWPAGQTRQTRPPQGEVCHTGYPPPRLHLFCDHTQPHRIHRYPARA